MVESFTKQLFLAFFLLSFSSLYGQKEVSLKINQYIESKPFSIGDGGINDLGTKFNISRLDYYISSIKLHHDSGMTTNVSNKYIFVSKGRTVDELLGNFNIGVLDSITFSVGVEFTDNHADPTLWPANHPLAPKSPEMHWGWAAGYRFVAIEGKSGSNLQFNYEIHALGDELYKPTTIVINGLAQNETIKIGIDADYIHSLKGINMNKNVILHGSNREAISLLNNYNKLVFKATQGTSGLQEKAVGELKIYPNPIMDGKVFVSLSEDQTINSTIIIRDAVGRTIHQEFKPTLLNEIMINKVGFYTIELIQLGKVSYRGSLIKQ